MTSIFLLIVANGFYKSVSNHNMTVQNHPKRNMNSMTQRIISAKFLRVKQLQNELTEAHKKINVIVHFRN